MREFAIKTKAYASELYMIMDRYLSGDSTISKKKEKKKNDDPNKEKKPTIGYAAFVKEMYKKLQSNEKYKGIFVIRSAIRVL